MKYTTQSAEETAQLAGSFANELLSRGPQQGAVVVGLYGDLGAGKTTFTQSLSAAFGVLDTVTSPTFVIEKIYELPEAALPFTHLIHIDAYRLASGHEMEVLGWKEIVADPHNIIVIEWPEKIAEIMPPHIALRFSADGGEFERVIDVEGIEMV